MANRAALIMAAVSGLLGGTQNARNEARNRDLEERKLAIQEAALEMKSPSHGVANLQYLRQMYPDRDVTRDEALRLLSPAGFGASPMPGELAAYMDNPSGVKGYLDTKARAGKTTYDFGDEDGGDPNSSARDEPPSRPAIRAPGASTAPASPAAEEGPAAAPEAPAPSAPSAPKAGGAMSRKRFNPATGQLEAVERVNFADLSTED